MCPIGTQNEALLRQAGACRFVWNWALARRKAYYAEHGKGISKGELSKELTALKSKPETAWLKEVDSQAVQQVLADLDRAYTNFFERRARFPRFKSKKKVRPSFRIPQRVKIEAGDVYIPKVGLVKIRPSQDIDGQTKSATFKQDACLNWYVTLVVAFTMHDVPLPMAKPANVVGLDAGLVDQLVLSNGEEPTAAPQFYRKAQKKLRRAQRVLSRRNPGSNRRAKAKNHVARVHQRTANQRQDFLHKKSTDLINRFDAICIEDLCIKGLAKTKLAKSFFDAAHGEFRRQLTYKAVWNRKHCVAVGRFFPSSKRCSACGAINDNLTLANRQWTCPVCGVVHDRDRNAAINIRAEGLRIMAAGYADIQNARGVCVRPGASRATDVEPRIPCL